MWWRVVGSRPVCLYNALQTLFSSVFLILSSNHRHSIGSMGWGKNGTWWLHFFSLSLWGVECWWSFSLSSSIPTCFPLFSPSPGRNLPNPLVPIFITISVKQWHICANIIDITSRILWTTHSEDIGWRHHVSGMGSRDGDWGSSDMAKSRLVHMTPIESVCIEKDIIIWKTRYWYAIWYELVKHSW